MLSQKVAYALRGLSALHIKGAISPERAVSLREIAEEESLPVKFLEQIMNQLRGLELVGSRKGVRGGYFLLRPAKQLILNDIIRGIEGNPLIQAVHPRKNSLTNEASPDAALTVIAQRIDDAARDILSEISLEDYVELQMLQTQSGKSPMYYI